MTSRDSTHLLRRLNAFCTTALEAAASLCQTRLSGEITVEHWLLKLLEPDDGDISAILRHYEIDDGPVWDALLASIDPLPRTLRGLPALSPQLVAVLEDAWALNRTLDGETSIRSGHVLQAIVGAPHVLRAREAWPLLSITQAQIGRLMPRLGARSRENAADHVVARESVSVDNNLRLADIATPPAQSCEQQKHRSTEGEALARFAIDLTGRARNGEIDPVFGREREIQQMVDVLARRRKNNPVLVGEPGVGKTALVEGLALRVADGDVPAVIRDVRVLTLDLGLLQAGAGVKGEFEQRLKNVIDEVKASATPVLLFIDEAHALIGAGNAAGGADAANLLKPALARGELRTIAATTWSEYKQFFERDAALERRFQLIKIDEPDDDAACLMLRGLVDRYASHHGVHIRDEALVAAVKLSRRYIPARQLPDKAVDLIDTAAARVKTSLDTPPAELQRMHASLAALERERGTLLADQRIGAAGTQARCVEIDAAVAARRLELAALEARYEHERALVQALHIARGATHSDPAPDDALQPVQTAARALADAQGNTPLITADVDAQAIARIVSEWTGVPAGNLVEDELTKLLTLETQLARRVIAQDDALIALANSLRTAKAGLTNEHAPLGVFLLAGPSGVGKTETALALADVLFGGEAALTTINLSEYQEAHTVSQLKGSPPGYVGYGRGGVLTEAVRQRPYSVVLLDEVDKAHRDVLDLFYQVFDRGTMRDGEGREIDFRHCVILMTSNLGSAEIDAVTGSQPDLTQAALREAIDAPLVAHFQAALLARFQTLVYKPLGVEAIARIVRIKLDKVGERLARQHGMALTYDDAIVDALAHRCLARASGARTVDALLNQDILPVVSRELLARMATAEPTQAIHLSVAHEGAVTIDFFSSCLAHSSDSPNAAASPVSAESSARTGCRI